jgi:LPXTG-motif cell wall-anchored protein
VVTPKFQHPHTGANLPVTAGAALVFMTGAYFLRRRTRNTEV